MEIFDYIQTNWLGWLFGALFAIMGAAYRYLYKRMVAQKKEHDQKIDDEHQRNQAIMNGIQALLRQQIIDCHHKYMERRFCPIYAKESIGRVYSAYHDLGGNDIATELYEAIMEMPVELSMKERSINED